MIEEPELPFFPDARSKPLLEKFVVGGFRGIKNQTFEHLGRINLLIGKNNSGKTSALEALAVYARPGDLGQWIGTAVSRNVRSRLIMPGDNSTIDAVRWMFPRNPSAADEADAHTSLDLAAEGGIRHKRVHADCSPMRGIPPERDEYGQRLHRRMAEEEQEDQGVLLQVALSDGEGSVLNEFVYSLWSSVGYRRPPRNEISSYDVIMLSPYSHRSEPVQLGRLTQAVLDDTAADIDELLHDLDKNILGVEIIIP